jgi:glycosyltransferase involved in cell wall biosynthesis
VNILYVSQYFPPEMGAPAARAVELARHWRRMGHSVTVLTGFPNHPTGVLVPEYRSRLRRLVMKEDFDGVNVVRTWLWPLPNRKAYERVVNYTSFWLSASLCGMFLPRPDIVIATSPQLLVGLAGFWIAAWKQAPFVFEVRDLWPESLEAVGIGKPGSLLHRPLWDAARFLYRNADHIVVVTRPFQDHLRERWGVPRERVSVMENGVETDFFTPNAADPSLREQLGLAGKFVVAYIGTLGIAQRLDTVIDAAETLKTSAPQAAFLFVGEGADKERIQSLARARRLDNLIFLDQQPRGRIPAYICAADAGMVPLKRTDLFTTVIPTKLLEFMSCARPVILGVDGESRRLLQEANAGIFVEPEIAPQLAEAILRLANDPALSASLGQNGRRYVVENLAREATAERYLDLLKGMVRS